jgi:hypothetical protein
VSAPCVSKRPCMFHVDFNLDFSLARINQDFLQDFKINLDFNLRSRHGRTDAVEIVVLDLLCRFQSRKIDLVEQYLYSFVGPPALPGNAQRGGLQLFAIGLHFHQLLRLKTLNVQFSRFLIKLRRVNLGQQSSAN